MVFTKEAAEFVLDQIVDLNRLKAELKSALEAKDYPTALAKARELVGLEPETKGTPE